MRVPVLKGKNVVLRPLRLSDAPRFCEWFKNPEVTRFLIRHQDPPSLREERAYIRGQQNKKDNAQWVITTEGAVIGTVGLRLKPEHRHATYGIFIGEPRYWGQGIGTVAGKLAVAYGFRQLRLHRIQLHVFAYNIRGFKSYKKIGFQTEGRLRDHLYRDGAFHDEIIMGLLKSEFQHIYSSKRQVRK